MGYQKTINLLDNASNEPSKKWIKINDQSWRLYNTNSDIRFETTMLKPSLYDYGHAYVLVKGIITITRAGNDAAARQADEK